MIDPGLSGKVALITGGNSPYSITVNVVSLGPIQTGWITPAR